MGDPFVSRTQFGMIPMWVIGQVSDRAVKLYVLLWAKYGDRNGKDSDVSAAYHERLAAELGCSRQSVIRALRELESLGAVVSRPRFRVDGSRSANGYRLVFDPPDTDTYQEGDNPVPPGEGSSIRGWGDPVPPVVQQEKPRPSFPDLLSQTLQNPSRDALDVAFAKFWSVYPKPMDKQLARAAFEAAVKRADVETILAGAERYAAERAGDDPHFTIYPERWLKRERWSAPPTPHRKGQRVEAPRRVQPESGPSSGERIEV